MRTLTTLKLTSAPMIIVVLVAFSLMLAAGAAADSDPKFTTIDFPDAVLTAPYDINSEGDIVGNFTDLGNQMHGFLLRNGNFTAIDFPDSTMTHAYGINSPGDIVGEYRDAGNNWHSFLLRDDNFTTIDFPEGKIVPWGISANRKITGSYIDVNGKTHACVLDKRGELTVLDPPFGFSTASVHSLTPRSDTIVGCWFDEARIMHSLIVRNGEYITNDFPGSVMGMNWRINPSGQMVGYYRDNLGKIHGYLFSNDAHTSIDFPGAIYTETRGINASGEIVGLYISPDSRRHGFLLSKE